MPKPTDIRPVAASLYYLPVRARMPLKFGAETLTEVTCARVCLTVQDRRGRSAKGWGETPLSVQWGWPGSLTYQYRLDRMQELCVELTRSWSQFGEYGHPMELGRRFLRDLLPGLVDRLNGNGAGDQAMPWLAALICCSAFDVALHDAYGQLHQTPTYELYGPQWMTESLDRFLEPAEARVSFAGRYPAEFLAADPPPRIAAWHLIGGLDPLDEGELKGDEPRDGVPVLLADWIRRDGLRHLKVKLRGTDAAWDYERLVRVGRIAFEHGVVALSADFNCTVREPQYVCDILDRLERDEPGISRLILYVEQPFPYDLHAHPIDVRAITRRKPLLLDESAHDWELVRLGRELGWTGVALKTCKTQTGAVLMACWARAHNMQLMVQDLTNPMLAIIPHVQLARYVGTMAGVEVNGMQFYPEASAAEEKVHPGLYRRRAGCVDASTLTGPGFGYRLEEMARELPEPAASAGE